MRFKPKSLMLPLAIAADLFALWVWAARPTRIYSEWLGLSPVPEASPLSRLRGWIVEENAPRTPSGLVSIFEYDELILAGMLLSALVVLVALMASPLFQSWKGLLSTSPARLMRTASLRIRVRTAIAAIAILGLYLGWEIDAWRIWPLWRSYVQQAADASRAEESSRKELIKMQEEFTRLKTYLTEHPEFVKDESQYRSKASLVAAWAAFEYRTEGQMTDQRNLILIYAEHKRKYERAAEHPREAVEPDPPPAPRPQTRVDWNLLGGTVPEMLALADEMSRRFPDYVEAHEQSAWIRSSWSEARYRDGKRAVESATRACELTKWKDLYGLQLLAAAYAEAGDFAQAVRWQEKVVELTANFPHAQFSLDRLALYKSGKPYRER